MNRKLHVITVFVVLLALFGSACGRRRPPVSPAPAPSVDSFPTAPAPPQSVEDQPVVSPSLGDDSLANRSLDELNRDSPLQPAFFTLDSSDLDETGRAIVTANAALLKKFGTWAISIEGHCDERGTPEYNLALGERRAVTVRTYLVSLGIAPDRLRTVSYGKEFPFDPGHSEGAWSKNRRAHFVITAK